MGSSESIERAVAEDDVARAFVEARRAGTALADFPGPMPATLAAAYRVQDRALALTDRAVAGWKVGKIDPPIERIDRLTGPIFADQIVSAGDTAIMPVFGGGFAAAEAEFLLRVGATPDPARYDYSLAEAAALIDAVHVGIEIASSPFAGINSHGPSVTISDFGNNNGLVIGPALGGWRERDILNCPVSLEINGVEAGAATARTMLDGPFGAAAFLFGHLARRGIAVPPGQWISSGAVTGVHPVATGDRVVARFGHEFEVECTIAPR